MPIHPVFYNLFNLILVASSAFVFRICRSVCSEEAGSEGDCETKQQKSRFAELKEFFLSPWFAILLCFTALISACFLKLGSGFRIYFIAFTLRFSLL